MTASVSDFELGAVYDFTTHAPSKLGTFVRVRVRSVVDHTLARNYIDPAALHANVYGSLPDNTAPDDYRRYYYLVVQYADGTTTAIGLPWIDATSIQKKEFNRAHVIIEDVSPDDLPKIKMALASNNFDVGEITIDE